jgi:hypothetical protein
MAKLFPTYPKRAARNASSFVLEQSSRRYARIPKKLQIPVSDKIF